MIIFTLEAAAVGFVASKSRRWALGSDLVFWLLFGTPLVYFFGSSAEFVGKNHGMEI
jgi:hypothetical protein